MKLNLTAVDSSQEKILAYLQQNASENLANKINNGTPFTKDNLQLLNKKNLNSFMCYATEEARKLATNGTRYACVDDATVFGWAIHYFEEESIEGKLYNLDGTEYKPVTKTIQKSTSKHKSFTAPTTKVASPKPQQEQGSLWDMLEPSTEIVENKTVEPVTEQVYEALQPEKDIELFANAVVTNNETVDTTPTVEPTIASILATTNIDTDTGEVLQDIPVDEPDTTATEPVLEELAEATEELAPQAEQQIPTFDRETMIYLATLLDNKLDIA